MEAKKKKKMNQGLKLLSDPPIIPQNMNMTANQRF